MIVFAHISDTHFGDVLANQSLGRVVHQDPHLLALCLGLQATIDSVRAACGLAQGDPLPVVHSGDLTLSGSSEEFAVAHACLRSKMRIKRTRLGGFLGLAISDDKFATVPGNHDHWQGLRGAVNYALGVPGFTPQLCPMQFRQTPWVKAWRESADPSQLTLELYGIDSSSGLDPLKVSRWAKGSISNHELNRLEDLLKKSAARGNGSVVRAVVCHHSVAYRAGFWGGKAWQSGELDGTSRAELLRICGAYRVAAILTGHTHDFHVEKFSTTNADGSTSDVYELRCASTLAGGQMPGHNGFWVHRIGIDEHGQRCWRGWRHDWNGSTFQSRKAHTFQFLTP
jgi:3',5'-cyclic AMP phosphodiesterase CpdA